MNSRLSVSFLVLLALLTSWTAPPAHATEPEGLQANLAALPFQFNNGILQITGRQAAPFPAQWTVIARDADDMGTITQLTLAGGQVVAQRPSFNLGQMFRSDGFFQAADILVDARQAFAVARRALSAGSAEVVQADYRLGRPVNDLQPVWTVTGRDAAGRVLGVVQLSAVTGAVLNTQQTSSVGK